MTEDEDTYNFEASSWEGLMNSKWKELSPKVYTTKRKLGAKHNNKHLLTYAMYKSRSRLTWENR